MYRNLLHFYTLTTIYQKNKEIKEKIPSKVKQYHLKLYQNNNNLVRNKSNQIGKRLILGKLQYIDERN